MSGMMQWLMTRFASPMNNLDRAENLPPADSRLIYQAAQFLALSKQSLDDSGLKRNFLFALENGTIVPPFRLCDTVKTICHQEHSRRSAIRTSTAQNRPTCGLLL